MKESVMNEMKKVLGEKEFEKLDEAIKKCTMVPVNDEPDVTRINITKIKNALEDENEKHLIVFRCPECGEGVYAWDSDQEDQEFLCCECMKLLKKVAAVPLSIIISMLGDF